MKFRTTRPDCLFARGMVSNLDAEGQLPRRPWNAPQRVTACSIALVTTTAGKCGHGMPEICRFFGIVVRMYYDDHAPPHFHVRYAAQKALVGIETLAVLRGWLSPKALGLVVEWAALHRSELMENWELARKNSPLKSIPALE